MPAKLIRLRYAGTCAGCSLGLSAGSKAWWDAEARTTTCSDCQVPDDGPPAHASPLEQGLPEPVPEAVTALPADQAGTSARQEYERRHQRREQRIDQRWGRLAGVAKFLSDDPQSTKAWAKGSEGERRLAAHLLAAVGDRAVLLHDRKVPGTRSNIDHLVIAASGIWVIDAKHYTGMVEQRDVGGWFKVDHRLYVGGRNRTKIAEGLGWQIEAVHGALGGAEVPVNAALCFIEAEWRLFAKPFQQNGVWVTWAKKLAEMISEPGDLTPADVTRIAELLAGALPPAVAKTAK
jgi:Nuclease-related domain